MNPWITLAIVIITHLGIALGEFPRLRVNRTTITLMGVGALFATGQIAFSRMGDLLDLNTLVLLFGMMILNANLQLAGFFRLAGRMILRLTHTPRGLLALLIALATAANIGSVTTLTGNPQNMIIGIASGISYVDFALALTPIALLGMGGIWLVIVWFYPDESRSGRFNIGELPSPFVYRPLLKKSLFVTGGLLVAFLLGVPSRKRHSLRHV